MRFIFYSPIAFEKWDWRNSVEKGIGGSETSHVEMSWRLAAKGHEVITYAPIPDDCPGEWRGTKWYSLDKVDFKQKGVWILYRCPEVVDEFPPIEERVDQTLWLLWQDWDYQNLTKKRSHNVDHHITLCKSHGRYLLSRYPFVKEKDLWLSSNGIKLDLIEEIEKENIKRNPKRIMYASSPDRGLKQALISFRKAYEFDPELEFHAFYGFNNLNKLIKGAPQSPLAKSKKELLDLLKHPGVHFHGRINQKQLMREWFKTGIYLYETNFFETSHISGMEAQACGAVPLFSPIFAQKENIRYGVAIEGSSEDPLVQARFGAWLVKMTQNPQLQDMIRPAMMEDARKRFNWDVFVDQWELEAQGKRKEFEKQYPFPEQILKI